jgi:hypothetical protein
MTKRAIVALLVVIGLVAVARARRHRADLHTASGEVVKHSEAMLRRQAVVISELFKIEDGRIRRIEAVMAGGLDHDASSGW